MTDDCPLSWRIGYDLELWVAPGKDQGRNGLGIAQIAVGRVHLT